MFFNFVSCWKALCRKTFLESDRTQYNPAGCIILGKLINFPQSFSAVPSTLENFIYLSYLSLSSHSSSIQVADLRHNFLLRSMGSIIEKVVEGELMTHISLCSSHKARPACCLPRPAPENSVGFAVKKTNWQPKN